MNDEQEKFFEFSDVVTSIDEIRDIIGEPLPPIAEKVIDRLDDVCRSFIERSPFAVIASADGRGAPDISPKGDPNGFVRVLDEKHLAIPDRPGNRRADTFQNLLENPQIAIIFIIPGKGETLRVRGEARIVRDEALRVGMAVNNRVPEFAIVVHVAQALMHCPKAFVRSKLWQPEAWPEHSDIATIAEATVAHARLDISPDELKKTIEAAGRNKLY
ncbi:MAG TPA: MSMEG_1061 family FMN-dependent PPOX-type flavoprotein [Gammaproteobacteria bacterium]